MLTPYWLDYTYNYTILLSSVKVKYEGKQYVNREMEVSMKSFPPSAQPLNAFAALTPVVLLVLPKRTIKY